MLEAFLLGLGIYAMYLLSSAFWGFIFGVKPKDKKEGFKENE